MDIKIVFFFSFLILCKNFFSYKKKKALFVNKQTLIVKFLNFDFNLEISFFPIIRN